jgi:hypothetical protein
MLAVTIMVVTQAELTHHTTQFCFAEKINTS